MSSSKRIFFAIISLFILSASNSFGFDLGCALFHLKGRINAHAGLDKAQDFNLHFKAIGTFSEIGAGQRVSQAFFDAKHARNSVAKAVSNYAMEMSNDAYGTCTQFVCEARLRSQLDTEYKDLTRVMKSRSAEERLFVFADTAKTDKTHGGQSWIGLRFQRVSGSEPTDAILHVRMKNSDTLGQQMDLGSLGVNLIHDSHKNFNDPHQWVSELADEIQAKNIEIDVIRVTGAGVQKEDNRRIAFEALQSKLVPHLVFNPQGEWVAPASVFYNKPIVAVPNGAPVEEQRIKSAIQRTTLAAHASAESATVIRVISKDELMTHGSLDYEKFSALSASGHWIVISDSTRPEEIQKYLKTLPSPFTELVR